MEVVQNLPKIDHERRFITFSELMDLRPFRSVLIVGSTWFAAGTFDLLPQENPASAISIGVAFLLAAPILNRISESL